MIPGHIVLRDGTVFSGLSVGATGIATGEVVFNTAMAGYQEVATDPSYAGQIVVMTAPHIGNYGVNRLDAQASAPWCRGFAVRSMSRRDSSWRSQGGFADYLAGHGVVALTDVDTRRLTRHVRERGAMPAAVGAGVDIEEIRAAAVAAPSMEGQNLAAEVTTAQTYTVPARSERQGRIVAFDLGIKRDILHALAARGFDVVVVPADTAADEVLAIEADGVFVSNGPGDPEPLIETTTSLRALLGVVPLFGICLGHQVLGLALGARTFKLPFGHHGGNHPVRRLSDGRVEITSQNHGFAVDPWSLTGRESPPRSGMPGPDLLPSTVDTDFGEVVITHQNLNDGTLEGMACRDVAAFSVQYHPEAAPGPRDAYPLFDRFVELMGAV